MSAGRRNVKAGYWKRVDHSGSILNRRHGGAVCLSINYSVELLKEITASTLMNILLVIQNKKI